MSWAAATSEDHWAGEERLAPFVAKASFAAEAAARDLMFVEVTPPRDALRGRLWAWMEGAIERTLEAQGAAPPRVGVGWDREDGLEDALRRARSSGARGLAVWVPSLLSIASPEGVLDAGDSETLRWWLAAASAHPMRLGVDPDNRRLRVYLDPVTLESLTAPRDRAPSEPLPVAVAPRVDDAEDPPQSQPARAAAPAVEAEDGAPEPGSGDGESSDAAFSRSALAMAQGLDAGTETEWLREALIELSTPAPARVDASMTTFEVAFADAPPPPPPPAISPVTAPVTAPIRAAVEEPAPDTQRGESLLPPVAPRLALELVDPPPHAPPPAPPVAAAPPQIDLDTRRKLEAHARELDAANGPKPLTVVERLFVNAYLPLRTVLDRGADLPALRETADEWAKSFEKSYVDAFDALRVRAKRPTMVVDVPDVALRVARLHGARTTQLLLVDGLRYDLGELVNDRLRAIVGQRAACAERFLMWAALPTTTAAQVELIGRGASGLKDFTGDIQEDLIVAHGRKAATIRRLKTGHRDVLKLDMVAARLTEPGGADPEGFAALADEVALRLAAHFEGQKPRTLVMIFGDHGFTLNHKPVNKSEARGGFREGGATPEEVLVPAYAWLVGAVH